jgi:hypothetical protein
MVDRTDTTECSFQIQPIFSSVILGSPFPETLSLFISRHFVSENFISYYTSPTIHIRTIHLRQYISDCTSPNHWSQGSLGLWYPRREKRVSKHISFIHSFRVIYPPTVYLRNFISDNSSPTVHLETIVFKQTNLHT